MKTKLTLSIETVTEAEIFLSELYKNNEVYHPEDNAEDIIWELPEDQKPTETECKQLNKLMEDIYSLPGNNSSKDLSFDPCAYILNLDPEYRAIKDNNEKYL